MKTAIDNGNIIEVSDDTPVRTIDGTHYLLTPEDEAEIAAREAEFLAGAGQRALNTCYMRRQASLSEGGYGTVGEQLDMLFHGTVNDWRKHIQMVKDTIPKPE